MKLAAPALASVVAFALVAMGTAQANREATEFFATASRAVDNLTRALDAAANSRRAVMTAKASLVMQMQLEPRSTADRAALRTLVDRYDAVVQKFCRLNTVLDRYVVALGPALPPR